MSGLEEMSREELMALTRALLAENARKDAVIAKLTEQVAALEKENAELWAENAALRERVARLERVISRNSGNSGMPPSGDDQPGKRQPKDKPAKAVKGGGKRKPGKQPVLRGRIWPGPTTPVRSTTPSSTSRRGCAGVARI